MINSKKELIEYINEDKTINHFKGLMSLFSITRKYLVRLRKTAYLINCNKPRIMRFVSLLLLNHYSYKTGIQIGINCFGKGLYLPHYGSIVVNSSARFGDYCIVQNGTNISEGATGGSNIYFGAGCKIMKNVIIADFTIVGANAVVTKSAIKENTVLAGIPAIIISNNGLKNRREKPI